MTLPYSADMLATVYRPKYWFRHISECDELKDNPGQIEFLNMWTGETYIHTGGTTFWDRKENTLNRDRLTFHGITHYRVLKYSSSD